MTTYRFKVVSRTAKRSLKCRVCSKRFARQRTFEQTINPWNRNSNGVPKAFAEIWKELGVECDEWRADDLCTGCANGAES